MQTDDRHATRMTITPDSPLAIGGLRLDRRVIMAPMAGVTTPAFRRSVRRWGAGLLFTEMISSCGIAYQNRRTREYLVCGQEEHPIGFQLFGAEPDKLAVAAEACVAAGADLIDINMPVRCARSSRLVQERRCSVILRSQRRSCALSVPSRPITSR